MEGEPVNYMVEDHLRGASTLRVSSHGSQVLSPTHVSKSQPRGKVPAFEPQETTTIWLLIVKVGS
jgi:hypothetical protein